MTSFLAQRVSALQVPPGQVSAWWLGGSGFIFKTSAGNQIWVDPYLSDVVAEIFQQPRAFPAPIAPVESRPDVVISTHLHEDHLDPGFIPVLARLRPETIFVMPPTAMGRARTWGVPQSRIVTLQHDQIIQLAGITITAVPARHIAGPGFEAPDAMGVILGTDAGDIYHTGDTEYDVRIRALRSRRFSFATFCINGISGNMNAYEAALLAWQFNVKTVVPHHHLLWAKPSREPGETLDPKLFETTYRTLGGLAQVILPEIAAEIKISQ